MECREGVGVVVMLLRFNGVQGWLCTEYVYPVRLASLSGLLQMFESCNRGLTVLGGRDGVRMYSVVRSVGGIGGALL